MLSRDDIRQALGNGSLCVYPLDPRNITGAGINLSATMFAFSISQRGLLRVDEETTSDGVRHYVHIPPHDTALLFSKEFVSVDRSLAGTFHSKVSCVGRGIGHISTTLDPTWQGQLIFTVGNPLEEPVRFDLDGDSGNVATLALHKLDTPVTGERVHDNDRGRCDVLLGLYEDRPREGVECEKYLETRDFLVGEYADSLNGYDDWLRGDVPSDRYSRRVAMLNAARNRYEHERVSLPEEDGPIRGPAYVRIFASSEERELVESCVLVELCGFELPAVGTYTVKIDKSDKLENCRTTIDNILRAIGYELKNIEHLRRVEWQNRRVMELARAESELQIERARIEEQALETTRREEYVKERRRLLRNGGIGLAVLCASTLALCLLVGKAGLPETVATSIGVALLTAALTTAIPACIRLSKLKDDIGGDK